jgi:uncharacterized protein YigA (DUF484 family)
MEELEERIVNLMESAKENYEECVQRIRKLEESLIAERNNLNQLTGAHAALQSLRPTPEELSEAGKLIEEDGEV